MGENISRRAFIKKGLVSAGVIFLAPQNKNWGAIASLQGSGKLGRNCTGGMINLRTKPSASAPIVEPLYEDTLVEWLQEVLGEAPAGLLSRRWVETPNGYIYAAALQPVYNQPNTALDLLPEKKGQKGMWVEVSVPYVDLFIANPPARSPWLQEIIAPRLYYSQVITVDDIQINSQGQVLYRINERYGTYGDIFWAAAEAFRPITEDEIAPIHPNVPEKHIYVDVNHQTLSCYEGKREVYFCRVSTGAKFDSQGNPVEKWSTPLGPHPIWRKLISIHMSGGGTGAGWDTPGVAWTSLFVGEGVAIHSTFWHNSFGTPRSHGCVNVTPDDAKWIFRWTDPIVAYEPGDKTVSMPGGTIVEVIQA
jgi:lipoprotein-anchoring transpeptidase ErfK/SrfK